MDRLGFIGLGPMGWPLSMRLIKQGFELVVHDGAPEKAKALLDRGAAWADTPALVAQAADVVLTAASGIDSLEEFIAGPSGVLQGAHPGLIMIDLSNLPPESARELAARCRAEQVGFLGATISGGPQEAGQGALELETTGPAEIYERCRSILEAMSARTAHTG